MRRIFSTSLLLFIGGILSCALVAAMIGLRPPIVPDEFSYLLAADTYSNGRLTNPRHPMWEHFGRPAQHIIYEPSYMSKYPPGQGLFLMMGDFMCGSPIWGVWITVGCLAAATRWMLLAWVPTRWATIGGCIAILQFGFAHYWAQTFMGAALPAFGGALVIGAFGRFLRDIRARDVFIFGLGLLLLAFTRPFEGLALSMVPCGYILWSVLGALRRRDLASSFQRLIIPTVIVTVVILVLMGINNKSVTGCFTRLPYQVHNDYSNTAPILFVLRPSPQSKNSYDQHGGLGWDSYLAVRSVVGAWRHILAKVRTLTDYYVSPACLICLLLMFWSIRYARIRWAIACLAVTLVAYFLSSWVSANYAAPATCIIVLLVITGLRRIDALRIGPHHTGRYLLLLLLVGHILWVVKYISDEAVRRSFSTPFTERLRIESDLSAMGGKHLVLVQHHTPAEDNVHAWTGVVFNRANIDASNTVWAWKPTLEKEAELLSYFKDRQVWLFEYQSENLVIQPMTLRPYQSSLMDERYPRKSSP